MEFLLIESVVLFASLIDEFSSVAIEEKIA